MKEVTGKTMRRVLSPPELILILTTGAHPHPPRTPEQDAALVRLVEQRTILVTVGPSGDLLVHGINPRHRYQN